jgi:hypothetical protein
MFLWVLCVLVAIAVLGLSLKVRMSSYFDSPSFQRTNWEQKHEREKALRHRHT